MAYREEETYKKPTTWTTAEVVSYCKTHQGDAKALGKIGLGTKDAQTYIKLYDKGNTK
jgi:hypothetical protein